MKIKKPKRIMSLFLAALMCVTSLVGIGTTAYAAEETDDVYLISYPRDGDSNYNAEWGHGSLTFMNGWKTGTSRYTTVRAMGSYNGNICYCIEIGVPQQTGDSFTKKGEDFWDNYPASYNSTISPDDIKLFIGRIFQYGYTGTISTSWRSQNEGGDKLAHAVATQLLSMAQGEVISESHRNDDKYEKRSKRTIDMYGYEDDVFEQFHPKSITPFIDPFDKAEEEQIEEEKERLRQLELSKVRQALSMLQPVQRERLLKSVLLGISSRKIAKEEGINYSSVDKSIAAAIKNFKKFYENL